MTSTAPTTTPGVAPAPAWTVMTASMQPYKSSSYTCELLTAYQSCHSDKKGQQVELNSNVLPKTLKTNFAINFKLKIQYVTS